MDDKEQFILGSAITCFSKYGYKKTSISDIYKEANVSKGLVYYYFKDKKELYLKSVEYSFLLVNNVIEESMTNDKDIISKLSDITVIKIEFFLANKSVFNFISKAYSETCIDLEPELENLKKISKTDSLAILFEHIDNDLFKDESTIQKAISIISFTMNGAYNEAVLLDNKEDRKKVIEDYRDILIKLFYKEEVNYGSN